MISKSILIAGTALATIAFSPAAAQDTPESPAETQPATTADQADAEDADIVVTATRREERLQDVPLAVTALNSEALTTRGINGVGDLGGGRVPGLVAATLFGAETSLVFAIRGFGPGDGSQSTVDMPVAYYVDGVNFPRTQGAGIDLVTPERIEVLRGPQGQLFGRNAHSGAIQVISKRPTGIFGGDFTFTAGKPSIFGAKGRLELPEMGGFRIQLSGTYRRHGGYINNPHNPLYTNVTLIFDPAAHTKYVNRNLNGDWGQLETYGGRVAIERDFGKLNFFYAYDNSISHDDQNFSVLYRSDQPNTIFSNFAAVAPVPLVFSNLSGPGGSTVTFTEPLQTSGHYPDSSPYGSPRMPFTNKSSGHILNLTYEASDNVTLRSITGQRTVNRAGGNILNAVTSTFFSGAPENMRSKVFSQEFQAIFDSDIFDLTAGATYFEENVRDERVSILAHNCVFSSAPSATCAPGSSQATTIPHSFNGFKRSLSATRAYGLYAQGTLTLGPVELTAGVRYSDDTKKGARVIDRNLGIDYDVGPNPVRRNRFHTSRWDPAFTVKYNLNDDISAYVRWAQGYRSGGSSVRSNVFSAFGEDEIQSWEVGFKSQLFDRRLTFNAAAFRNKIIGQQLSIQTGLPNVAITDFINSPEDRIIKGFELEATARLLRGLTVSGAYTYLKSSDIIFGFNIATLQTFISDATFSPATGLIPSAAEVAAHPNSVVLLIGPIGTPKHSGTINVDYVTPSPTGEGELALHLDWVRSTRFLTASPEIGKSIINPVTNVSGCETTGAVRRCAGFNNGNFTNQFNARLALRDLPINGNVRGEIALWVKNIFNRADPAFAFVSGINSVSILQPPRTLGADFRVKF